MLSKFTHFVLALSISAAIPVFAQEKNSPEEEGKRAKEKKKEERQKNGYAHAHSSWFLESQKKKPDVRKAEAAFTKYFSKHPGEDSKIKSRFLTWMQPASLYRGKAGKGGLYPAFEKNSTGKTGQRGIAGGIDGTFGTWKMIGPANLGKKQCGNNDMVTGGFCDRVYVNPYNTQNLFAGFSYGGLWVSRDQGNTWQLTDGSFPNGTNTYANRDYYYGEIEAHKMDSNLVYAATESGLLKSGDGGINWMLLPELNRNNSPNERPYYVALATDDEQVVLSTFGRKLYRSSDGGNTWTVVFDNSNGGANHRGTSQYNFNTPFGLNDRTYNFFGLEANFSNPNEFYLGVWNGSNQACIYRSTDKGASFSLLVNLNTLLSSAWNGSTILSIKTIPSSPDILSVLQHYVKGKPRYRISSTGSLLGSDTVNAYVEAFDIDWNNRNIMYQGEYSPNYITRSTDSGRTFAKPYNAGCNYLHADIRGISAVGNVVLVGNDGGLGLSLDGGKTVVGTGFEINSMDIWGFSSSPKSDIVLAGLDHNQTFVRSFDGPGGWRNIKGADAGVCTVNPYQDRWLYYDWAYGINKGFLNNDGSVTESSVAADVDLGTLQFHPYLAYNIFGFKGSKMMQSSDNMTTATLFKDFGKNINAIRMTGKDAKTMYVLLANSTIMKTTDSGSTWVDVTPPPAVNGGQVNITAIETGKTPDELWAAYGNAQNTVKVLSSTDGGSSWTNITTPELPAAAVNDIAYQRGTNGGVYIMTITKDGTKVWYRNNTMPKWEQVGSTLPMMGYLKSRLFIVPAKNKIRFGSSRGAWENELYERSGLQAGLAVSKASAVCSLDSIEFYNASAVPPGPVNYEWHFPGGSPAFSQLENPRVLYSAPGRYDATLKITDANGNTDSITWAKIVQFDRDICGSTDTVAGKMLDISSTTSRIPLKRLNYDSTSFTVMMWVKPKGLQKSFSQIVSVRSPNRLGIGFAFKGYAANTNLVLTNSTLSYGITSTLDLVPDAWSHIAVTYTAQGAEVYVNGGTPWSVSGNFASIDFSQQPLVINDDIHGQGGDFKGQLEELTVYNYTMTQQEIREKMHLIRRPSEETGLLCYYQFNQYDSLSSTLYDAMRSGVPSSVNKSLIVESTAPVATGLSETRPVNSAGAIQFPQTGLTLTYTENGTFPKGDVVVSRLESAPAVVPVAGASRYWVIHNYGDNQANAISQLQLHQSPDSLYNVHLQKRAFNSTGVWSNPSAGNRLVFDVSGNDIRNQQVAFALTPNSGPVFTAPASLSIYRNDTCGYNADTAVTGVPQGVSDDSGIVPQITFSDAIADTVINRSWTATDDMGRSSRQTQLIMLKDTTAPAIQYADSLFRCYNTLDTYTLPPVQATDNCAVETIRYKISGATTRNGNGADASGHFNAGVSWIDWLVTDKMGNEGKHRSTLVVNAPLQLSIPNIYAVNPGGAPNTIYLGYGPQMLTLSAQASGGTAPYTFNWSNGSMQNTTTVQPATAGLHSYTVTITDRQGCTDSASHQVTVADIRSMDNKVTICHDGVNTLSINTGSVQDHIAHGDHLGACRTTFNATISKTPAADNGVTILLQPNPSTTGFVLKVNAKLASGFIVRVYNLTGQLMEEIKANTNEEVRFGQSYKAGMYMAEIRLGTLRKTVEVIKL
jgi:photosystem II stability/assembly factor-like uncharacterized protein